MRQYNNSVVLKFDTKATGNAGSGKPITVRESDGTGDGKGDLAALFDELGNPIENPTHTDSDGNYTFVIADGVYDIVIDEYLGDEFKTIIPNEEIIELSSGIILFFSITSVQDQVEFILGEEFGENPAVTSLSVNGRVQDPKGSGGSGPSYTVSGSTITLSDALNIGDKVTGSVNASSSSITIFKQDRGISYSYPSLREFLNTPATLVQIDDYIEFRGLAVEGDGMGSVYQVKTGSEFDYSKVIPVYEGVVAKYVSGFNKRLRTDNYEIAAHRGFTHFNVEGTMYAFTSALEYGADSLECDVQFTSDGEMVLYHDIDTTEHDLNNITGRIKDNTYAQVQAATFKQLDGNFMQPYVQVAKFTELLDYIRLAGCRAHIEIKAYRTEDDIQSIVNAITERDIEGLVVLHSFRLTDIQYVRNINEQIQVSLLATVTTGNDSGGVPLTDGYDWLKRDKNSMFAVSLFGIDNDIPNGQEFVKVLQDAGVQVAAWTAETEIDLMFARRNNINVIISDLPIYRKQPTRIRYEQSF